jgi:hypothetical protein
LSRAAYTSLIECGGAVHLTSMTESTDGDQCATFTWEDFPYYTDSKDGTLEAKKAHWTVELNLGARKVVKATLGDRELEMDDLIIFISHMICTYVHPQIHAYANWGIDPQHVLDGSPMAAHLRTASIASAIYNHFGKVNAPDIFGALYGGQVGREFTHVVEAALTTTPPLHADIRKLNSHSQFVRFVVKLRGKFFAAFKDYRSQFPENYSAESYFLGTVLHSLDHWMYCRNLDKWTLVAIDTSPEFASMRSVQECVRFAVSDDLPGLLFPKEFKDISTPFHQAVYSAARAIDPCLADHMQPCIIK